MPPVAGRAGLEGKERRGALNLNYAVERGLGRGTAAMGKCGGGLVRVAASRKACAWEGGDAGWLVPGFARHDPGNGTLRS